MHTRYSQTNGPNTPTKARFKLILQPIATIDSASDVQVSIECYVIFLSGRHHIMMISIFFLIHVQFTGQRPVARDNSTQ
jgi:hypothetical protein